MQSSGLQFNLRSTHQPPPARRGCRVRLHLHGGLERIHKGGVRAIVLDITANNASVPTRSPDAKLTGIAAFEQLFAAAPHIPVLIICDPDNEFLAKEAAEHGARDYILRPNLQHFRLRRIVHRLIQQKAEDEAAFLQQQCAEAALACTGEAVVVSDRAGRVSNLNAAAEHLTGWSRTEALGRPLNQILRFVDTGNLRPAGEGLVSTLVDAKYVDLTGNCTRQRRDGVEVAIKHSSASTRDRAGKVTGAVAVLHDVGAARAKTLELSHLAQHDFLTDLPNRVLLNDRIKQAIAFAERDRKQLAVMFVDLDSWCYSPR
jgi:PAS domain S-box-containing protein